MDLLKLSDTREGRRQAKLTTQALFPIGRLRFRAFALCDNVR